MSRTSGQFTGQISWVYTEDLASSVGFWRDVLGLAVVRDAGSAMIFETMPSAFIGVCEIFGGRVVQPEGSMTTLLVADQQTVDVWYAHLSGANVPIQGAPKELVQFGIYSFFCTDPNGYIIEIQCFLT